MRCPDASSEGFASVSIDFPFHGERLECVDASLVATPNFLPPSLRNLNQDSTMADALVYYLRAGETLICRAAAKGQGADPSSPRAPVVRSSKGRRPAPL